MVEEQDNSGGRNGQGSAVVRDWTQGGIIGNLWLLAWPMMVSSGLNMLGPTIDMIWVGKLGIASMAGVGISGMAVMVVNSIRMGLATGTKALIARFIGAQDEEGANHVAQQALVISSVFSIILAIIGIFLAESILTLMGVEADVVSEGAAYMRIMFVGSVAMSFRLMAEGIMQASGDSVTPMRIVIGARIFHVVLAPFLIFGWWIFPALGVSGAAFTNVLSQTLGGAIGLWFLFSGRTRMRLTLKNFSIDREMIWRIVRIGLPASITGAERTFANLVLMWFIVPFGTAAVAAHSLMERIDMFIHMPVFGLAMAAGILAGQNLGASLPERAEKTAWQSAGLVTVAMVVASAAIWFWSDSIVSVFNTEPDLVRIAGTFLKIQIVSYLVFGLVVVLMQCLNGVGDTMIPMVTTLVTMWAVQVPLAYILPRVTNLGVYGVRWGIVIAILGRAVMYTAYFKTGRWKSKRV